MNRNFQTGYLDRALCNLLLSPWNFRHFEFRSLFSTSYRANRFVAVHEVELCKIKRNKIQKKKKIRNVFDEWNGLESVESKVEFGRGRWTLQEQRNC